MRCSVYINFVVEGNVLEFSRRDGGADSDVVGVGGVEDG